MEKELEVMRMETAEMKKALLAHCSDMDQANERLAHVMESLPRPCDGERYKDCTASQFFEKFLEEVEEAKEAAEAFFADEWKSRSLPSDEYSDLMCELTDVITAITSFMEAVGCDLEARMMYQRKINHRNAVRDDGKRFRRQELWDR